MATLPQITSPPQASSEVLVNQMGVAIEHTLCYANAFLTTSGLVRGYYGGQWGPFTIAASTHTFGASTTTYVCVDRSDGSLDFSTSSTNFDDEANFAAVEIVTSTASATTAVNRRGGPGGVHGSLTPGVGVGDMALASVQTVTGAKTFNDATLKLAGSSSGAGTLNAPAVASTYTWTLPAATGTLLYAGGALGTPASGTLSNCTGLPLTTGVTGVLPVANYATGTPTGTKFVRDDGVLAVPSGASGTVTHTGGALTANAVVLGAGTDDAKVVAGITSDGASALNLGVAGASVGKVVLANATSGTITMQPPTGALGTVTLTLPTATDTLVGKATTDTLSNKTLVAPALGTPASGDLSNCTADGTNAVGFRHIPQNSQSTAYTAVLADAGKHILHPSADTTARTMTIPANSSVAYPIGTALTFVNQASAGVMTIAITTDTMRLAGAGTTGSRTLAANGIATALKLTSTEWIISGTGLT